MLEVVMNSDTVAHIQAECGGFRGALREDPMLLWLEKEHVLRPAARLALGVSDVAFFAESGDPDGNHQGDVHAQLRGLLCRDVLARHRRPAQ